MSKTIISGKNHDGSVRTSYVRPILIPLHYVYDFCCAKVTSFCVAPEFSLLHLHIVNCVRYNWGLRETTPMKEVSLESATFWECVLMENANLPYNSR